MKNKSFTFSNIFAVAFFILLKVNAQKQDFYLDKFEKANFQTVAKSQWFTYSDSVDGGGSFIRTRYIKDKTIKSQFLGLSFQLHKENWKWTPYAALACSLKTNQFPKGIVGIAYDYKGRNHRFVFRSNQIKDFAFYQREIPESSQWTTAVLPFSELKQPSWGGKKVDFDATEVNALAWEVFGEDGDTGRLEIDNIRLVYSPIQLTIPKATPHSEFKLGTVEYLYSNILKEERTLWVYLPQPLKELKKSNQKYPVIYLLDGNDNITSLAGILEQLGPKYYHTAVPEVIIIGILNTDRWRDLTPTHADSSPFGHDTTELKTTGGGENFIRFIEKELVPHIDSMYPTAPHKTFIGHSLGGLTVLNTLIYHPNLFNAYIAIDPSLWWNNHLLTRQADFLLSNQHYNNQKVFIAIANTYGPKSDTLKIKSDTSKAAAQMNNIFRFTDLLKKHPNVGLNWTHKYYPDDDHGSVPIIAEYDGLRLFFKNYRIKFSEDLFSKKGFNLDSAFTQHYELLSKDMGFQILPPEGFIDIYGNYFLGKKEFKKADQFFSLNVRNYPQSFNALKSLGSYFEEINDKPKAIQAYSKANQIKSSSNLKKRIEELKDLK